MVKAIFSKLGGVLGSLWLSVALLALLTLMTWLGTRAQEHMGLFMAQKKYFESWLYVERLAGIVPFPLPGGMTLMSVLFVNLLIGGLVKVRWKWQKAGILITHIGIVLLLGAGFVKGMMATEGYLQLFEGERSSVYRSHHDWEIVLEEAVDDGVRQWIVPDGEFLDRYDGRTARVSAEGLPFKFTIHDFLLNSTPMTAPPFAASPFPAVDGAYLKPLELELEHERNVAGCRITVDHGDGRAPTEGLLWGFERAPMTVDAADGRRFGITLRKKELPMPFTVKLDEFTHEYYPNTMIPKVYMSDVTVIDEDGPAKHKIRMNEPLRQDDMIVFQSSWGPTNARPGERLYSGFSVVENPADQWPWYSMWVIAAGMLLHFGLMLLRFIDRESVARSRGADPLVAAARKGVEA